MKMGIIAGRGDLPQLIIDALTSQNQEPFILAVKGDTNPNLVTKHAHEWIEMAEIARTLDIFRAHEVSHIVMAGGLSRPPLKALKPPALAARILKRLGASFFKGDDALFKAIVSIFEEEGFTIVGVDEVLKDVLTPSGVLTQTKPKNMDECIFAINAAKALGARDIGQAVIVKAGAVLAEETVDGTDALIEKTKHTEGAILAKAKKPKQERRIDLPTIGTATIDALAKGNFAGVVLEAHQSLILHREQVIALADKHHIFIVGIEHD